ncbi:MAG: hypothetical protein ABR586_08460 [Thermoplasmatota archaeon]
MSAEPLPWTPGGRDTMNATLEAHRKKAARKGTAKKEARVAKKAAKSAKKPAKRARRRAVPEPTPPGPGADGREERDAMVKVVLAAVPGRAYVTEGDIFEAARQATTRRLFPGATHRMWAERVLLDLAANAVLEPDGSRPPRWRRARTPPVA